MLDNYNTCALNVVSAVFGHTTNKASMLVRFGSMDCTQVFSIIQGKREL